LNSNRLHENGEKSQESEPGLDREASPRVRVVGYSCRCCSSIESELVPCRQLSGRSVFPRRSHPTRAQRSRAPVLVSLAAMAGNHVSAKKISLLSHCVPWNFPSCRMSTVVFVRGECYFALSIFTRTGFRNMSSTGEVFCTCAHSSSSFSCEASQSVR
jgi:hypothetical protein